MTSQPSTDAAGPGTPPGPTGQRRILVLAHTGRQAAVTAAEELVTMRTPTARHIREAAAE